MDVVYFATTHPSHHQLSLQAIEAGKAVLITGGRRVGGPLARSPFSS